MTDPVWMVSSSVLIVAVIALRAAFGSRMKPWLRCALWALVTLRLIVPGTVFSSPVSIEGAVERAQVVRDLEAVKQVSAIERTESGAIVGVIKPGPQAHSAPSAPHTPAASALDTGVILESSTPERFESIKRTMEARDVLRIVWLSGAAVCALWCLFVNLRFGLRLYRGRERYFTSLHCRVYSVKGLESPCCFMGSIYVPEDALGDRARLDCILQHELAHRRHGDGVTAVLRNAALALHWYNPLAWAYAVLSRRDGELFADDGAIRALGEDERENYGRTLIELSRRCSRPGAAGGIAAIASTATTMTGGKRSIRERIAHIALPEKTGVLLTVLLLTLALFAAGCAFIGGESAKSREEAAAQSGIVFSAGNEFTAKEGYDTAELSFPEGNEYLPRSERIPLGAKFLLPEGWSVRAGLYEDLGYYPTEEMSGLCLAARLSFDKSFSVYNEKGECVGTIGHSALYLSDEAKAELAGLGTSEERVQGKMKCCFAPIIIGMSQAELFYGDHAAVVPAGNELVISTIAFYEGTRKPDGTKDEYSFPLCAAFDDEYDYGFFIEFADGAVTDEQLYDIASSMRIGRLKAEPDPTPDNGEAERRAVIENFYAAFEKNDYETVYELYAPTRRGDMAFVLDPESQAAYRGILALKSAKVLDIREMEEPYFFDLEKDELKPFVDKGEDYYRVYEVEIEQEIYSDQFFVPGRGVHVVWLVREDGAWYIGRTWAVPDSFSTPEPVSKTVVYSAGSYYEYVAAARNLLSGRSTKGVYSNEVYFRLDEDSLTAFAKVTEYSQNSPGEEPEYSFEYSEPIAEYPREVGERALELLYGKIAPAHGLSYGEGPWTEAEGFAGKNWFVLKTADESMQDIQMSCIFCWDGAEWREFGSNNDSMHFPLTGACIVDADTGFLSYHSKFLDEPEGSYRKIWLYRTDDGGRTWTDVGLELPEEYGRVYPGCAASPVFDGAHGVMPVYAYDLEGDSDESFGLWYETFDGGITWELRGEG